MVDIKSMDVGELQAFIKDLGEPAFRAKQIYEWLHVKLAESFSEMSNLPLRLREKLQEKACIEVLREELCRISKLDDTRKYLFALKDGNIIESVSMSYKHGQSVCVSSQVGCRMGCTFCASTLEGLQRNLTAAEMLEQVYRIQKSSGRRVSNVVIMGSGEPLDNYENVVKFIRLLSGEGGLCISQRNITLSTCGILPQIRRLAEEKLQITLALSLHAPDDEIRRRLMPVARAYGMRELLDACRFYFEKTGRRVSYEYSLVAGLNDNLEEAGKLVRLLKDMRGHINLIPVNPIEERDYKESSKKAVFAFKNALEKNGLNVTVRREMGRDIDGACGQLRRHYKQEIHKELV